MKSTDELLHTIALTLVPGIGPVRAKNLIAFCGGASAVFKERKPALMKIPGIGKVGAEALSDDSIWQRAEAELKFIDKYHVNALLYSEDDYPNRLKQCEDGPVLLYTMGKLKLNAEKMIAVVGTRKATAYGRQFCEEFIHDALAEKVTIISGLAYGIDISAHRCAIQHGLATVACLAHGLDRVYPSAHTNVAKEMMHQGGLVTEFISGTKPDRELFPVRNRIIAGLSDCVVVVESDVSGGSVITAHVAAGYNREVFAVPGRYNDKWSAGCNKLIQTLVAGQLTSFGHLAEQMNWTNQKEKITRQAVLFTELNDDEAQIMKVLNNKGKMMIDLLSTEVQKPVYRVSSLLLELEFKGLVKALPGKMFEST